MGEGSGLCAGTTGSSVHRDAVRTTAIQPVGSGLSIYHLAPAPCLAEQGDPDTAPPQAERSTQKAPRGQTLTRRTVPR